MIPKVTNNDYNYVYNHVEEDEQGVQAPMLAAGQGHMEVVAALLNNMNNAQDEEAEAEEEANILPE